MREIKLTQGKIAIIDDEDFNLVNKYKWHFSKSSTNYGKAISRPIKAEKAIRMHRLIMNPPSHLEVDHIDGNPLNNTRNNLRLVTHAQNQKNMNKGARNKSGYKGVSWHKKARKWQVSLMSDGQSYHLGLFKNKIEAAKAYNTAALQYFGEFAKLNEIKP